MSTIEQNELFAVLRDLENHSITIPDATDKILALSKAEMKEVVTEDILSEELADLVEEQSDTPKKAEDVVTNTKKSRK